MQDQSPIEDRSRQRIEAVSRGDPDHPIAAKRADAISPLEMTVAIAMAVQQNGPLSDRDLPIAVARIVGFLRAGPKAATIATAQDRPAS